MHVYPSTLVILISPQRNWISDGCSGLIYLLLNQILMDECSPQNGCFSSILWSLLVPLCRLLSGTSPICAKKKDLNPLNKLILIIQGYVYLRPKFNLQSLFNFFCLNTGGKIWKTVHRLTNSRFFHRARQHNGRKLTKKNSPLMQTICLYHRVFPQWNDGTWQT